MCPLTQFSLAELLVKNKIKKKNIKFSQKYPVKQGIGYCCDLLWLISQLIRTYEEDRSTCYSGIKSNQHNRKVAYGTLLIIDLNVTEHRKSCM